MQLRWLRLTQVNDPHKAFRPFTCNMRHINGLLSWRAMNLMQQQQNSQYAPETEGRSHILPHTLVAPG